MRPSMWRIFFIGAVAIVTLCYALFLLFKLIQYTKQVEEQLAYDLVKNSETPKGEEQPKEQTT